MKPSLLSVVIPSYNEMANLQKGILDKVEQFLTRHKFNFEVLIVDDGSNDGSREFVERFSKENKEFRLIENEHTGKAGAVTKGMLEATGEIVLFTDMDQATPIEEVEKLLPYFEEEFDIVIGSRSRIRKGAPLTRKIMAKSMIILRTSLVGLKGIKDTQCGFKMFTKKSAREIFGQINTLHKGFRKIEGSAVTAGFDIELLYIAEKMGYKIKEVPVEWLYVETRRVNPITDSVTGLFDLLKIKQNIIKGIYK